MLRGWWVGIDNIEMEGGVKMAFDFPHAFIVELDTLCGPLAQLVRAQS